MRAKHEFYLLNYTPLLSSLIKLNYAASVLKNKSKGFVNKFNAFKAIIEITKELSL